MSDGRFEIVFEELHGECGNRFRRFEVESFFTEGGFEIERVEVTETAERRYAERTVSRLRRADGSRYWGLDRPRLEELGCRYVVRRNGGSA